MNKFDDLNSILLSRVRVLLPEWLPGGKLNGKEYQCGDITGRSGKSLSINIETGVWKDFATGEGGSDLISLYASINKIRQGDSFKKLNGIYGSEVNIPIRDSKPDLIIVKPPPGVPRPKMRGIVYEYRNFKGDILNYITRIDSPEGKRFVPYSYTENGWVKKHFPKPRPLFGLELIKPDKPILLVEGEKACLAARRFASNIYTVMTWPGGAEAWKHTDLSPLHGKKLLLWPDADDPGIRSMDNLAAYLVDKCPEIKIIDTKGLPAKHDAADFQFTNFKKFAEFARPRAIKYTRAEPDMGDDPPPPTDKDMLVSAATEALEEKVDEKPTYKIQVIWKKLGIPINQMGTAPIVNMRCAVNFLKNHESFRANLWFDEFHKKVFTDTGKAGIRRELTTRDVLDIVYYMQEKLHINRITKQNVEDAIQFHAYQNIRNEPLDWLKSLQWDGHPRVKNFLSTHLGSVESDYTRAISKNFWVSMAARIFRPGCKADNMIILEGKQGAFKSSALEVIGGDWYAQTSENPSSKDFYQILHGKLLVEIAELDSFNKAERNTIKKVMSQSTDRFRSPYAKAPEDYPRQCIFAGTTNDSTYLNDPTGARRFWPVAITDINLSAIEKDREQLFAEAVSLYKGGENWYEVPLAEALEQQEMRRNADIWEPRVLAFLDKDASFHSNGYTTIQAVCDELGIDVDRQDLRVSNRIGAILRAHGFASKLKRMPGSRAVSRIYFDPVQNPEMITESTRFSQLPSNQPKKQALKNYADCLNPKR